MSLVTPCDSLSTMVKHSGLTGCPVKLLWWCIGDGALRCSLSLSPKVLPDSPIYSSGHDVCAFKSIYDPTLLKFVVPVLEGHKKGFNGVGLFEIYLDPQAVACSFEPSSQSKDAWYHYGDVLDVVVVVGSTLVVRLVVSGCLSIVVVVFGADAIL